MFSSYFLTISFTLRLGVGIGIGFFTFGSGVDFVSFKIMFIRFCNCSFLGVFIRFVCNCSEVADSSISFFWK